MRSTWNPVVQWLNEVRQSAEIESLSALQAKSVAYQVDTQDALVVRNAQIAILNIRKASETVLEQLDDFIDALPISLVHMEQFRTRFLELCTPLCSLIDLCKRRCALHEPPSIEKISELINSPSETLYAHVCECSKHVLRLLNNFTQQGKVHNIQLAGALQSLRDQLTQLSQMSVRLDCKSIVNALYAHEHSSICRKWCLLALWQLTQNDPFLCKIFTCDYPLIKALVNFISDEPDALPEQANNGPLPLSHTQLKGAALRVLTHLCAYPEAIIQIYSRTAIELRLMRLLEQPNVNLQLTHECVRLIVQITRIFAECANNSSDASSRAKAQLYEQLVSEFALDRLIECLTGVLSITNERQIFLLSMAAFANLSFVHCYAFVRHRTVHILMGALENRVANFIDDLPIKDQILTFLANLADSHPLELLHSGGLVYLISALCHYHRPETCPLDQSSFEQTLERIQQKASTAIGRLAVHPTVAPFVYKFQGVGRLVALCVDGRLRNHSDNVLLAALAALRRAAISLGTGPFEELKRLDLVQLPFKQAFSRYALRPEMYV